MSMLIEGLSTPAQVVVTGASSGIGLALVTQLLAHPQVASVCAISRRAEQSDALHALQREHGERFAGSHPSCLGLYGLRHPCQSCGLAVSVLFVPSPGMYVNPTGSAHDAARTAALKISLSSSCTASLPSTSGRPCPENSGPWRSNSSSTKRLISSTLGPTPNSPLRRFASSRRSTLGRSEFDARLIRQPSCDHAMHDAQHRADHFGLAFILFKYSLLNI